MSNKVVPDNVLGWIKFVVKVVLYAAGLLMAGYGTAEACNLTAIL